MGDDIRVIGTNTCPSLSGTCTLGYEIGCNSNKDVYLRISSNTGGGIWNQQFVALSDFSPMLSMEGQVITAKTVKAILQGKSVNTIGFFIAVLLQEGLLKKSETDKYTYLPVTPSAFRERIQFLAADVPPMPEKPASSKKNEIPQPDSQP